MHGIGGARARCAQKQRCVGRQMHAAIQYQNWPGCQVRAELCSSGRAPPHSPELHYALPCPAAVRVTMIQSHAS